MYFQLQQLLAYTCILIIHRLLYLFCRLLIDYAADELAAFLPLDVYTKNIDKYKELFDLLNMAGNYNQCNYRKLACWRTLLAHQHSSGILQKILQCVHLTNSK